MGCPEKSQIEQLVAGALDEKSSKELLSHLNECSDCRREAAFLTAVRLSLPAGQAGPQCLSDESLCLLCDDLLQGPEREKALAHLCGCRHCLGAWLSLDRSLEEAALEPVPAPAHLVKRAAALGAKDKQTEKISFLQRLLGPSPVWRLSLAGAAAALVLVVAVVLTSPATRIEVPKGPVPPAPVLVSDVTGTDEPPAVQPQKPPVEPVPNEPGPSVETPRKAQNWLAALPDQKRLDLISNLKPKADLPRVEMGKAYKTSDKQASVSDGYQLGRHLGYLLAFAGQLDSPGVRSQLAEAAGSLVPMLTTVAPQADAPQLQKFAKDLQTGLNSRMAPDTAKRRLEVLKTAVSEKISSQKPAGLGFELGLLASQLEVASTAQKLGYQPPPRSFPTRKSVSRVRTLVRKAKQLPEKDKQDVLSSLERIEQMTPAPDKPARASKILEEIHTIDRNVRATR